MIEKRNTATETMVPSWYKYKKCGLLNTTQHIDIYGKTRACYSESSSKGCVSSIVSLSPRRVYQNLSSDTTASDRSLDIKLSRFSVTTKISSSYPKNDNKSKKNTRNLDHSKRSNCNYVSRNIIFNSLVPRM